ncbi:MAG: glycosyltransferase [Candidatus Omnitrophica bacterium]|nr:glycosyltransferase [Candidatus Omnitrophota bacterium]
MLKVRFSPDYSRENPYQSELAKALFKEGVEVSYESRPGQTVWHLHWPEPFLFGKNAVSTVFKTLYFSIKIFLAWARGVKLVRTVHNLTSHEGKYPAAEYAFNRLNIAMARGVIVHCPSGREALVRRYHLSDRLRKKIHVIPHGNFLGSYPNDLSRTQARARLGLDGERGTVFLLFGLLRRYKGVEDLLNAFEKLKTPGVSLVIAGKPADLSVSEAVTAACRHDGRVRFYPGFIPADEVQIYFNAADAVVMPYTKILSSSVLFLAMSFGKAVIAPRIGCLPQSADPRGTIFYDPDPGGSGLSHALAQAVQTDLGSMGRHHFEAAKRLDWGAIGRQTADVYRRMI